MGLMRLRSIKKSHAGEYALDVFPTNATDSHAIELNPFLVPGESIEEEEQFEEEPDTNSTLSISSYSRQCYSPTASRDDAQPHEPREQSRINLLVPPNSPQPNAPLIICLHGSNDSCMGSWLGLIEILYKSGHRVLLYDRPTSKMNYDGSNDLKPHRAVSELCSYLYSMDLHGPFIFVAHSYGGCIARLFLQQKPRDVAGMVLVETGQAPALAPRVEDMQYRRQILGSAPLSVVRGDGHVREQLQFDEAKTNATTETQSLQLEPQRLILEREVVENERLEKKQLQLSRRSRLCRVSNHGNHIIRDFPEVVAEEVKWVARENAASAAISGEDSMKPTNILSTSVGHGGAHVRRSVSNVGAGLKRGLSQRVRRSFSKSRSG